MRRLKDRSGLSLASLQTKTGYSSSSWERYLNGRALPPQKAVEELARAGGVDPARLLALHEVAQEAWKQEVATAPAVDTPEPRNTRRVVLIGVCTAVVLGVLLAGLLITAPWKDGEQGQNGVSGAQPSSASTSRGAFAYKAGKDLPLYGQPEEQSAVCGLQLHPHRPALRAGVGCRGGAAPAEASRLRSRWC
ncbi:helix-turn-helix domain-containing protein [Streptomyces sp. NPDC057543]|uniref:helix-turn-helix domain-containing protein n=1 Tax=Streptomyces sp. NPDC057543 TaxID=3346163 RepID=UPI0036B04EBE